MPPRAQGRPPSASDRSPASRACDRAAAALALGSLALALGLSAFHAIGLFGPENDFYGPYVRQAERLLRGQAYNYPYHPPGYSALLAAASMLTGDFFVAGKWLSALGTALFGWLTYLVIRRLFDARIAVVTMALCLVRLVPMSYLAATDTLVAALMMLPVWIILRAPRVTLGACALAGACAGLAYLMKTTGLFLILGLSGALLLPLDQAPLRRRARRTAMFAGGVLLVALPWFAWKAQAGLASLNHLQMAAHFFMDESDSYGTVRRQAALQFGSFWDVVRHDPIALLRTYIMDVVFLRGGPVATQVLQFPAYLFAGAGLLLLLLQLSARRAAYALVCAAVYLALALVDFKLRFYVFLFPFAFLCVGCFLFQEPSPLTRRVPGPGVEVRWLAAAVLLGYLGAASFRQTRDNFASEPRYLFDAAREVRRRASPGDLIIGCQTHLEYLTGLLVLFPFAGPDDDYWQRVRELKARFLVYTDRDAVRWAALRVLQDPRQAPSTVRLIYRHEPTNTLVYEVVRPGG